MQESAAEERLRVGLVGLGEVGQHHLLAYEQDERVSLVATADLSDDLSAGAHARTGARAYSDYTALLEHPDLDAVDICLPHHLHLPAVLAALDRGAHVLVEKPMGMSVGECDRMITAANNSGRILAVSHNQLFFSPHRAALQLIADGAIGTVKMARLRLGIGGRYPGWRLDPQLAGGGLLFDAGVHRFYMARAIFGEPVSVQAMTDIGEPGIGSEAAGIVMIGFAHGCFCVIDANYGNPSGSFDDRIEIAGDRGLLQLAGCEAAFEGFSSEPPLRWWHDGGWETVETEPMDWSGSVQESVRDFVGAILEHRRPVVAGEDGRAVVGMVRGAYEAARSGRRVEFLEKQVGLSSYVAEPVE